MIEKLNLFVDPIELYDLLKTTALTEPFLIIDLCNEHSYVSGHIPGAIHVSIRDLISGLPPAPGRLPSRAQLEALFTALNYCRDHYFLIYDDEGGGWASRFGWTLDVIGHSKYSIIDGGLIAWKAEGLPLEKQANTLEKNQLSFTETPVRIDQYETNPIAEISDILEGLADDSITIWDARSPMEFQGKEVYALRGGHIPGAINCEWTNLMDTARAYRVRKDAESFLGNLGIRKDKKIITHCQSHHRSAYTYMVGKHLDLEISAYHGSWSEWGNRTDTPIESFT